MRSLLFMTCWISALIWSPSFAIAESNPSTEDTERAEAHFQRASELYSQGRFQDALEEFEAAQRLAPHSANLFNMARCHENLGQLRQAIECYENALAQTDDDDERQDISRRIASIRSRPVRVFVTSEPDGASILVDGNEEEEPERTPTTVELTPGPHNLWLQAEGYQPTLEQITVEVGQESPVSIELMPGGGQECGESQGCQRVDRENLHAHLTLGFPLSISALGDRGGGQILPGVGFRAHLTYNRIIVGGIVNFFPAGTETVTNDAGAPIEEDYSVLNMMLEAGYCWPLEIVSFQVLAGIGGMTDINHTTGTIVYTNSFLGWLAAGLDVHAFTWLSIGLEARLGMGATLGQPDNQFELVVILGAQLSFHI